MIDPHCTLPPYPTHLHVRHLTEEEPCYCGCMLADHSLDHRDQLLSLVST
jgi:hypothetical protein